MRKNEFVVTLDELLRFLSIISVLISIVVCSICGFRILQFESKCTIHIKNASKATSIEEAVKELDIAIQYAEETGRTHGLTTKYGVNDLGIWYRNLLSSKETFLRMNVNSEHFNTEFASVKEGVSQIMFPTYISFYESSILKWVDWICLVTFIIGIFCMIVMNSSIVIIRIPKKQ